MRKTALAAAAAGASILVAGCGGRAAAPPAAAIASPSQCRLTAQTRRQLARAQHDLARLRTVAAHETRYTELGSSAMQLATGRYLDDLTTSKLDNFRVNRLIDLGASVASATCGQCFQMLEAARPIVSMKYEAPQDCT